MESSAKCIASWICGATMGAAATMILTHKSAKEMVRVFKDVIEKHRCHCNDGAPAAASANNNGGE